MPARKVREDLEVATDRGGIVALVEFRWRVYWSVLARLVRAALTRSERRAKGLPTWRSFPSFARGLAAPVASGQMVAWKADRWKRIGTLTKLIHDGVKRISEDRRIRGVLLLDRATELALWVLVTHYVVGGDNREDSDRREGLLAGDIDVTVRAVKRALRSGWPVALCLDANIRRTSDAYREFVRRVVTDLGGTIQGDRGGVEYLITYPGRNGTVIDVSAAWETSTDRLWTDHEGLGITATLASEKRVA